MIIKLTKKYKTKAFHPGTMGVIYDCSILEVDTKENTALVEFYTPFPQSNVKKFNLPTDHLVDVLP